MRQIRTKIIMGQFWNDNGSGPVLSKLCCLIAWGPSQLTFFFCFCMHCSKSFIKVLSRSCHLSFYVYCLHLFRLLQGILTVNHVMSISFYWVSIIAFACFLRYKMLYTIKQLKRNIYFSKWYQGVPWPRKYSLWCYNRQRDNNIVLTVLLIIFLYRFLLYV